MPAKSKTGIIRQKVVIPKSTPEAVYKALISSKEHAEFTGSPADVNGRKGAKFTAWDGYISGKNISMTKGEKIEQEWSTTEFPEGYGPSILKISLKKKGDGTELTMVQYRVPASQVKKYESGWYESYWDPLVEYFENRPKK